jgi:hypothetical protein
MAVVYSIRNWDDDFEVAQSKKIKGPHQWVAIPTKHDGKSFRRLMLREDGPQVYAAWILLIQVAAKCTVRGVLADGDGPLGVDDLSIKTGCPAVVFENAIKVLSSKEIGWLVVEEWETGGIVLPPQDKQYKQNQPTNQPPNPPATINAATSAADASPADHSGGRAGGSSLNGWALVQERLCSAGVSRWREAISEARSCGCTPGHAMELLAYAKANGKLAGAIVCRFAKASPSLAIDQGWPETPPALVASRKSAQSREDRIRQEQRDSEATAIIKAGRRAQKTEAVIRAELDAVGLEWPK